MGELYINDGRARRYWPAPLARGACGRRDGWPGALAGRKLKHMCSNAEWERLRRRVEESVEQGDLRELFADAAACVEALVEDIRSHACAHERRDWGCGRARRSRPGWVV
jgi:hypothetical protein